MIRRKPNDTGAKFTVTKRFFHTAKTVSDKCHNRGYADKFYESLVLERKTVKINRKDQTHVALRHDDFPNQILH